MTNPTTDEIIKVAQSGNTGEVKTLTDIKLEAFEKRLAEMEKINAELRAANAELYAYASTLSQPQAQPAVQPQAPAQPVAAAAVQPSQDQAAVEAARQREEENLNSVLATMGYRKAQNTTTTPPNDGM